MLLLFFFIKKLRHPNIGLSCLFLGQILAKMSLKIGEKNAPLFAHSLL